jgi:hypothetical protein
LSSTAAALLLGSLAQGSVAFAFNPPRVESRAEPHEGGTNREVGLHGDSGRDPAMDATDHRPLRNSRTSRAPRRGIGWRAFALWAGIAMATNRAMALPGAAPEDGFTPAILSLMDAEREFLAKTMEVARSRLQAPAPLDPQALALGDETLAEASLHLAEAVGNVYQPGT